MARRYAVLFLRLPAIPEAELCALDQARRQRLR
jgi:hypothetical protein